MMARAASPLTARLLAAGLAFPEGPAFAPDGSLWAVELKGGCLVRWHDGQLTRHDVGGAPNGLAIDGTGRVWFCDSQEMAVRCFDPATQELTVKAAAVQGAALAKPNDLAFDRAGNLVFTCPGESRHKPTGYVCALRPDGAVEQVIADKFFPNGLAFSADGQRLVLAETYRHRLWVGDWNAATATWTNGRVLAEVGGPIGPDGLAFAQNGDLYVAVYGAGCIKVVTPEGRIRTELPLTGANPTNCAFDPSGRLGLVVTEAERGELLSLPVAGRGAALFDASH